MRQNLYLRGNPNPSDIRCFKNDLGRHCNCKQPGERDVTLADVMQQVERGRVDCSKCGQRSDLHTFVSQFPVLGALEAVFGLLQLHVVKQIPATATAQVIQVDVPEIPSEWAIIYCNFTPMSLGAEFGGFEEMPRPLGPQNLHQNWGLPLSVYVPAGGERQISFMFVCRDETPLPLPIDLGLQACDLLGRCRRGTACVLAAASIEASLRDALARAYQARGVSMPESAGFMQLLGLARMMLNPLLGSEIVGSLRSLANEGRNPAAHGSAGGDLTQEQVAHWLVDAALIYEWAQHATVVGASSTP